MSHFIRATKIFLSFFISFSVYAQKKECALALQTFNILDNPTMPGVKVRVDSLPLAEKAEYIHWYSNNKSIGKGPSINLYESGEYKVELKNKDCGLMVKTFNVTMPISKKSNIASSEPVIPGCDPNEPNGFLSYAKLIPGTSFAQLGICFDTSSDIDWFKWIYNGRTFYIKVKELFNNTGYYSIYLSLSGTNCTITTASYNGSDLDTYVELYDSNGTTLLKSDDDSGAGYYSTITFNVSPISLGFDALESSYICNGGYVLAEISSTAGLLGSGDYFSFYLSDNNGSFANLTPITAQYYSYFSPSFRYLIKLPNNITNGNYKIRAIYNPFNSVHEDLPIAVGASTFTPTLSSSASPSKCPNVTLQMTSSTSANSEYIWLNDGYRETSASNIYQATYEGEYRVLLYHSSGCSTVTPEINVTNYPVENPSISFSPSSPTLGQAVSGSVYFCSNGTSVVNWEYLDKSDKGVISTKNFTQTPQKPIGYEVYCVSKDHFCRGSSDYEVLFLGQTCDPTEPNQLASDATSISGYSHESYHCFENGSDNDFYKIEINSAVFYLKVGLYSTSSSIGNYILSLSSTTTGLTIETKPLFESSVDTKIFLYAADATTLLASDDDSGYAAFSKILYQSNQFGCLDTYNITHKIVNGTEKYPASNQINATNKLQNNSRTTYTAGKSIILQPNFTVEPGTVFVAEISGCQ